MEELVENLSTDSAGVYEDLEAEGLRRDRELRQSGLVRDKTVFCVKTMREVQVRLSKGMEDFSKARSDVLVIKKAVLKKQAELAVLLEEERKLLEVESKMHLRVASLEEAKTVAWANCAEGMVALASHFCEIPSFPGGDTRVAQLARIDSNLAMSAAKLAVSKDDGVKPQGQSVRPKVPQPVRKELKVSQAPEPKKLIVSVTSGSRSAREVAPEAANSRRAPTKEKLGRRQILLKQDQIPSADQYR